MSAPGCVLDYISRGWSPVPIPYRKKRPPFDDWQKLRIGADEAARYFNGAPQNVGIILGEPSGHLVDSDLDCREALTLAPYFLPPTESIFGRESKPRSHWLYIAALARSVQHKDPDNGEMLLELRSNGGQTVFPGSTHPSGEPIEWHEDGDPTPVDPTQLTKTAGRLAAACLLVRAAPAEDRHSYLLDVSGCLVRGLGEDGAANILRPVARVILGGLYNEGEGKRLIADTARKLAAGEPIPGFTRLAERIGEKRARKVAEWLGIERERPKVDDGTGNLAEDDRSHDALALRMGERWGDARHVALWGRWYFYNGRYWQADERLLHLTRTREFLRREGEALVAWAEKQREALIAEHGAAKGEEQADRLVAWAKGEAKALRSAPMVANVVGLARSNPRQVATVEQWDADPFLLGTPGGTVDLRTGAVREARPADYITKQTAVAPAAPGADAPVWRTFLERIFRHDPELVPYMQRVAGYALTGSTREHALVFAWGQGGNGKSVFFNTLAGLLGIGGDGYAAIAPADMLLVTHGDRHPTDLAMMRGARLVTASELEHGRAWDEPKLKSLTGGDPITARFMRQDFFTYLPQFTLLVAGNHKPSFRGVDEAIRRRVQLVPFLQNIPREERDPHLPEKLKAEWPAILRWAIDGCLAWQREGLNPPKSVREASADYLEGEDTIGQWLAERCILRGGEFTPFTALFKDWQEWCQVNGGPNMGSKTFSKELEKRPGITRNNNGARGFRGVWLLAEEKRDTAGEEERAFRDAAADGARGGRWRTAF